jgi:hypothetical protein
MVFFAASTKDKTPVTWPTLILGAATFESIVRPTILSGLISASSSFERLRFFLRRDSTTSKSPALSVSSGISEADR